MTGDCHIPFLEGVGVRFPRATRPYTFKPQIECICYASGLDGTEKREIYETFMHYGHIACTGKIYLISKILDFKFSIPLK